MLFLSIHSSNNATRGSRRVVVSASGASSQARDASVALVATPALAKSGLLGAQMLFHDARDVPVSSSAPQVRVSCHGVLGTVQVGDDVFLGVVLDRQSAGVLAGAPVYRITKVAFFSLLFDSFDEYNYSDGPDDSPTPRDTNDPNDQHPCTSIMKLFNAGSFYYSPEYDLTRSTLAKATHRIPTTASLFDSADPTFFWNHAMLAPILQMRSNELSPQQRTALDNSSMLILAIQGFAGIQPLHSSLPAHQQLKISIISRLSCRNAGTRFNARGIDDDGSCSNFVETEVVVETKGFLASFVVVRGSVPVFWEQTGIQIAGHRVELSRGFEVTELAFRKHMENLEKQYGKLHIVNLLSGKEGGAEATLVQAYEQHVAKYNSRNADKNHQLAYSHFDYHSVVKNGGHEKASLVLEQIKPHLESWSYTLIETKPSAAPSTPVLLQQGVMRVNCLDCLDRTNHIEYIAAQVMVQRCLHEMQLQGVMRDEAFMEVWQNLWADNGDWLSKIYTGTGALKTSMTRRGKQTMMGVFSDAAKSVSRFYINNFQDKHRQEAIDIVLGKQKAKSLLIPNNITAGVEHDLLSRKNEFVTTEDVTILIGTWNVNGKLPNGEPIEAWLESRDVNAKPNLVLIGIQELIELNAQQFMQADFEKLRSTWETHLLRVLNQTAPYVLLRSLNLMALGIFAYVRRDCVDKVRFVEISQCKTGFGGVGANKGGVGLSLEYQDTSMLIVTAHLAAGESAVEERNRDYKTITDNLSFKRKLLKDHDMRFWFGDFNYRVSLPNEEARAFLEKGVTAPLLSNDQLSISRARGLAFDGYEEPHIKFNPTYKYDNGTMTYDTSEKARCPSWTDRVLFAGKGVGVLEYTSTDSLLMSDHRPVRAIFKAK
ncbi:inositol polyphosphate 5-phosphatase, partial [Podochytrium sp. JEL0797]